VIAISKIVCPVGPVYISLKNNKKVACGSQNMGLKFYPTPYFLVDPMGGGRGTKAYPGRIF